STDGGLHWEQLESTRKEQFRWVNRIALAPDGKVILAATRSGMYRSADDGKTFEVRPLPTDSSQEEQFRNEVLDVKFHWTDSNYCVASGRGGNVYWSKDGGTSWTSARGLPHNQGFEGRVELAYAASAADDPS